MDDISELITILISKKDISITRKDRTHAVNVLRIILFEKKCLEEMNPYITVKIKRAMLMPVSARILITHIQARIVKWRR